MQHTRGNYVSFHNHSESIISITVVFQVMYNYMYWLNCVIAPLVHYKGHVYFQFGFLLSPSDLSPPPPHLTNM